MEDAGARQKPAPPLALGFAFEIDQIAWQLPPERRQPRSLVHACIYRDCEEYCWGPLKWEADRRRD